MKLIKNARIINEGQQFTGSILIDGEVIKDVFSEITPSMEGVEVIDATGLILMP